VVGRSAASSWFGFLLACTGLALSAAGAPSSAPNAVHRRMAFMCGWIDGRYASSWRLRPCDEEGIAAATDATLKLAMDEYVRDYPMGDDFQKAYLRKYPPPPHVYSEAEVHSLSDERLCVLLHDKLPTSGLAKSELTKRNAFSAHEWDLVRSGRLEIGMSQKALTCSWGQPTRRNRTVTAQGENIQLVYPGTLIYTVNGIVTAFQD
jgi:hypothetical protein